jgi:transcriptional regulator with XRE-family HTH domain
MATKYVINQRTLLLAAELAGDTRPDGTLHLTRVSERAGVDRGVISRVANGKNRPNLDTLMRLAAAYSVAVEKLVEVIEVDDEPTLAAA